MEHRGRRRIMLERRRRRVRQVVAAASLEAALTHQGTRMRTPAGGATFEPTHR